MSVRYIHTPAQAQAELERQRAAKKASYNRRKERMLNDEEYREQQLHKWKTKRDQKRKAIEEDPLHVNKRQDADRMAKVRRAVRETQNALDAQDREEMIEKVRQRYIFSHTIAYIENLGARRSSPMVPTTTRRLWI